MPEREMDHRRLDPLELIRQHSLEDYIGEPVSQLQHALQCASLATRAGSSPELVVAALFHDIGHLSASEDEPRMPGLGVLHHEEVGARWLAQAGFNDQVCELVRGHVAAKRYLSAVRPGYLERLSLASRATLELQGGPMSPTEIEFFANDPLKEDKLRLRVFDERAKDPTATVPELEAYLHKIKLVRQSTSQRGDAQ